MSKNTNEAQIRLSLKGFNNMTDNEILQYTIKLSLKNIVQNTIITDHNNFSAIYSDNIKVKNRINISRRLKEQKLLQQEQNIKLIKKVKEHDKKYTMTFK
tara:strand:- start:531 stop:830 length:300 start_codon:yes stop_codon:yes gene_type:complete